MQIKINNLKLFITGLIAVFCISNSTGCSSVKEYSKGFLGVSTKVLEEGRKNAKTKTFNFDYFTAFTKTLDALKNIDAYIYAKDIKKHMIAVYVSSADTTPVGIFFQEIDAANTQVEVSSPSTYAKELMANRLFKALEKTREQ
jgi:hypothetical protein